MGVLVPAGRLIILEFETGVPGLDVDWVKALYEY